MKRRTLNILLTVFLFAALILIATVFKKNPFIRGFLGDTLVVVFLFFLVKSIYPFSSFKLALGVFIFACGIEFAQYFHLADVLGLENKGVLRIILGATFDWMDILSYFTGAFISWTMDTLINKKISV